MKTLKLIALIALAVWGYNKLTPDSITVPGLGMSEVKLNADSIRAIIEVAGASQQIEVVYDTAWIEKTENFKFFGIGIDALEKDLVCKYTETRTWIVKAVCKDVEIDGNTILLSYPVVDTATELEDKFRVISFTGGGSWNPTSAHVHLNRSRRIAEAKARRDGIESAAAENISHALSVILPNNITITYK